MYGTVSTNDGPCTSLRVKWGLSYWWEGHWTGKNGGRTRTNQNRRVLCTNNPSNNRCCCNACFSKKSTLGSSVSSSLSIDRDWELETNKCGYHSASIYDGRIVITPFKGYDMMQTVDGVYTPLRTSHTFAESRTKQVFSDANVCVGAIMYMRIISSPGVMNSVESIPWGWWIQTGQSHQKCLVEKK